MNREEFLHRCPTLWHVGPAGSWDGIRHLGFRTAEQLIRAADLSESRRDVLLAEPRRDAVTLQVEGIEVTLRDQGPLLKRKDLDSLMGDGLSAADWVGILNRRVYLFRDAAKMKTLLSKYVELNGAQDVITFSPRALYELCRHRIELSTQNTGAVSRTTGAQKHLDTFRPVGQFPAAGTPQEITVVDGIDDLSVVAFVERRHADGSKSKLKR